MQKHQRGSIIGFVVVGVLLAIAVVGGIYLVKNQLNGNMPDFGNGDEVAVVQDEAEETTDEGADTEAGQDDQSTDPTTNENDDVATDDEDVVAPAEDDETATPSEDEAVDESATVDNEDNMPQTGVESADELPQTGVADNLYALIAIGALTGSIVAFRRSNLI